MISADVILGTLPSEVKYKFSNKINNLVSNLSEEEKSALTNLQKKAVNLLFKIWQKYKIEPIRISLLDEICFVIRYLKNGTEVVFELYNTGHSSIVISSICEEDTVLPFSQRHMAESLNRLAAV